VCQDHTADAIDQFVDLVHPHLFALLLHQAQLQHLGLDLDVISIGFTARRLLPLAPQVSQVRNAALVEREAATFPLDHAIGFELADVSPAAIKMLRQCRRADGRGLCGRAVNGGGFGHRVRSCCFRGRILRLQRQREGVLYPSPIARTNEDGEERETLTKPQCRNASPCHRARHGSRSEHLGILP